MQADQKIECMGYASGVAAGDQGCGDGPAVIFNSEMRLKLPTSYQFHWNGLLLPGGGSDKYRVVADTCSRLAKQVASAVENQHHFVVFGGDHTCAIGTWSGVYTALQNKGELGLIWFDAHLDSHTPETSESGNIHGMPLASLMGQGATALKEILSDKTKTKPENICIIGARSFESREAELIKKLGVRVYYMDEIKERGLKTVFAEATAKVTQNTLKYGISIDLDGIDPSEAPGVGIPEVDGVQSVALCQAIKGVIHNPKFVGMEIVEFNPHHDHGRKTEKIIFELIQSMIEKVI